MAAADSRHVISCPKCGARFAVAGSLAGRKARCDACDEAFVVPRLGKATEVKPLGTGEQKKQKAPPLQASPAKLAAAPAMEKSAQLIGLECRVCGTRLYGRREDVGKKIKCPDCGAGTEIPPPPKPKPLNMPAALFGEQYELWDADEAPLPSELAATQPKYIAVTCRVCQSLLYATEEQIGQQILCTDCGTKNVVPLPKNPVVRPSVLAADRDTPQLDAAAAPGDRPVLIPRTLGTSLAEQRGAEEYARAREESRRTGKPMTIDERGRPVLPRFPLLTGILTFPFLPGVFARWMALTIGLMVWALPLTDGLENLITAIVTTSEAPGMFAALIEVMLGAVGAILWFAAASNIFVAIATQSAVGANRIEEWPTMNFLSSMSEMLPVGIAILFAAAPGWMLSKLMATEPWQTAAITGGSLVLGLPLIVLSQFAGSSNWEIIDPKVFGAALRCPFSMLLFWFESLCLVGLCVAAGVAAWNWHPYLPLATAPLVVGCMILYARSLGRLGWRLAEKIVIEDPTADDAPQGPKNYNPPRGKAVT